MAFDVFMKIDGIPGESTDDKHKAWIELISFKHGISQPSAGSRSTGGAGSAGRATHGDVVIEKQYDKSSPKLVEAICNGKHIPKIEFEFCRATGDKLTYLKYELTDVLVTSVSIEASMAGDEETSNAAGGKGNQLVPTETVNYNYGEIKVTYTETDHKTGKAKGNVAAGWSSTENKPV